MAGNFSEHGGIMRELRCRDAGFDCDAVVQGESDDEVLAQAGPHAEQEHRVQVTSEMKQQLAGLIHDA
jgi:predicted small metal-binding protein